MSTVRNNSATYPVYINIVWSKSGETRSARYKLCTIWSSGAARARANIRQTVKTRYSNRAREYDGVSSARKWKKNK